MMAGAVMLDQEGTQGTASIRRLGSKGANRPPERAAGAKDKTPAATPEKSKPPGKPHTRPSRPSREELDMPELNTPEPDRAVRSRNGRPLYDPRPRRYGR